MMEELRPARPVAPGRILKREIEARGWTQRDLAAILGRPEQLVSEIINGGRQITPETSVDLGEALGTSPEFWYNLESNYRLQIAQRAARSDAIPRRVWLYEQLPLQEMNTRGWLKLHREPEALEAEVCGFFGVTTLADMGSIGARLRCSTARGPVGYAQLAWLRRVEQLGQQQSAAAWQPENIEGLVRELLTLATGVEAVARVRSVLAKWGIRSVFLKHLAKTYLDGAALHADERPCVALTLRYDRIDSFWFTLLHEIAHIARGDRDVYLDSFGSETGDDAQTAPIAPDPCEEGADQLAGSWLIDQQAYVRFVEQTTPYFSKGKIEAFAASVGRHPGIVLGRLQREGHVPYSNLRSLLVKVSPHLKGQIAD